MRVILFEKMRGKKMFVTLDKKIAKEFYDCARTTIEYPNDYGSMRSLREDLQELCGLTELEAHNVLINRNVADYIGKYNGCSEKKENVDRRIYAEDKLGITAYVMIDIPGEYNKFRRITL